MQVNNSFESFGNNSGGFWLHFSKMPIQNLMNSSTDSHRVNEEYDVAVHEEKGDAYNSNENENDSVTKQVGNALDSELYRVFQETRPSPQHTKSRNDLLSFIQRIALNEMNTNKWRKRGIVMDIDGSVLFGSSPIQTDILGADGDALSVSDIDHAILIKAEHAADITHFVHVDILKSLKQRLSKVRITPVLSEHASADHYDDAFIHFAHSSKEMKMANGNRRKLLKDRKCGSSSYHSGPYSLKIASVFQMNPKKGYSMALVKITDPMYNVRMDLCIVGEEKRDQLALTVAVLNRLLSFNFDVRIRPFMVSIKYWSKRRGIASTWHGFMNSYCFLLMGIKYLQMVHPPILPAVGDGTEHSNMRWAAETENESDLKDLLLGFFSFWSAFDDGRHAIDIRERGLTAKEMESLLVIIDPVNPSHNCASSVNALGLKAIYEEMERAKDALSQNLDWAQGVCAPFK